MRVIYFGCYRGAGGHRVGHYFYLPGGMDMGLRMFRDIPWGKKVDAGLAPLRRGYTDRSSQNEAEQGAAALHHEGGWTALSFWDRTGDTRPHSNSTFLFDEELTFDEALTAAREHFPELFERFDFEVVEA